MTAPDALLARILDEGQARTRDEAVLAAEVRRLRSGAAETPREPCAWPTPAQWIRMFVDADPELRLEIATRAVLDAELRTRVRQCASGRAYVFPAQGAWRWQCQVCLSEASWFLSPGDAGDAARRHMGPSLADAWDEGRVAGYRACAADEAKSTWGFGTPVTEDERPVNPYRGDTQ